MAETPIKIAFHKALRKMIAPMVDLAIKYGISVNDISQWLRAIFVERAEHFTVDGKRQSASRIALLTGLDRKEVTRIRKLNQDIEALLQQQIAKTNHAIRAVNAWQREVAYSENGSAKVLPLHGEAGSLKTLAAEYCGDVSSTTLLDELKRAGMVELVDDGKSVKLLNTCYVPDKDKEELLSLMGQAAHDLISTSAYNIESPLETRFQITLAFNDMHTELAEKLKIIIQKDSMELLTKLDNWLNTEIDLHEDTGEEKKRAGVGIYYFEEPVNKDEEQ